MKRVHVYFLTIFLLVLSCSGTGKEKDDDQAGRLITIRGKVGFPGQGTIKISDMRPDQTKPWEDTIRLKNNMFVKQIRVTEPGYYQLNFYNAQFVNVILDKNDLEINVDGNNPGGFYEVKGSPDLDLLNESRKIIQEPQNTPEAKTLEAKFNEVVKTGDEAKIIAIQDEYQVIMDKGYDNLIAYLKKQPLSLGMISLLQGRSAPNIDKYFPLYIEKAEQFKKEWPNNYFAKEFVIFVQKQKVTAIGQPAPEISLPDPAGKIVSLSSLRGKYILVDFWAKWCGPCRQENPNVVKAYHEFKGKNFDILGVSLDRNKDDWTRAIAEDGLVWTQVSDLKYFESKAATDYNINGIPFSILVDPKGIIIAKNLRGNSLQKKLREVLPK